MIAKALEAVALNSIALGSVALRNNNRSLIDKRVTGITCHAGFHRTSISQTAISQTYDR